MKHYITGAALVGVTIGLSAAAIRFVPAGLQFPVVELAAGSDLQMTFLGTGQSSAEACRHKLQEITKPLKASSSGLAIAADCVRGLNEGTRKLLSRNAIDAPSTRLADGTVVVYRAVNAELALAACRQTEAATASQPASKRVVCTPAGLPR